MALRSDHEPSDRQPVPRDSIDRLIADWVRIRPDLDVAPVGIVNRLARVRSHFDAALNAVFAAHGLSAPSFAVLVTLARLGDVQGVSQRRLMDELGLTSGTISVRIDRLVAKGLVRRRTDPVDRRNVHVSLTESGRERFERAVPDHLENERRLVSALTPSERDQLAALLRKLLVEFEGSDPPERVTSVVG